MGMAPVTHVLFTRSVYAIVLGAFASSDSLQPGFSMLTQRAQSGSIAIASCFLMGMFSLAVPGECLTQNVSLIRIQSCVSVLDRSAKCKPISPRSCALQYIVLHLLGYKLSLDDLKAFRQLDSLTPGHPEAHHTDGQKHLSS